MIFRRAGFFVTVVITVVMLCLALTARAAATPPDKVSVGMYVTEIYGINLKEGVFNIDAWVWFRAAPGVPSPLDGFEIRGGRITSRTNLIKKTMPDRLLYTAARITATIHKRWDLHHFPFDDHQLAVHIEDPSSASPACTR